MNPNQIDWSGIRANAVTLGVREAARRAATNLPPIEANRFVERVLKRSARQGWLTQKQSAIEQSPVSQQALPMSATVLTGSEAALSKLKQDAEATKSNLSSGILEASKHIASTTGAKLFKSAKAVKEIIGGASQLHGWDQQSGNAGSLNLNILMGQAVIVQSSNDERTS